MKRWIAVVLGLYVATLGLVSSVQAQVACGDTIVVDTVLDSDLFCGGIDLGRDAALTVVGPAKLDLDGHRISCNDCFEVMRIEGQRARVTSGAVGGGDNAFNIVVAGEGRHFVWDLRMTTGGVGGGAPGIRVESDRNRILDNDIEIVFGEAIQVTGARNLIHGNVTLADGNGILVEGPRNLVTGNDVTGLGFGIKMTQDAQRTFVTGNVISASPDRDGIVVETDHNLVAQNVSSGGQRGVVVVEGAKRNHIIDNVVIDNLLFDLFDGNPDCDRNRWAGNVFDTANQDCIDSRRFTGRHRAAR